MKFVNNRVQYSILAYVLLVSLICVAKPPIFFDKYDNIKSFGIGEEKTLFSLGVLVVSLSILVFYVFAVIDIIFASR
jgi:hypothetical protein